MRFTTLRDRVAEPLFAVFIATGLLLSVLGVLAWRFATPSTRTEHIGIQPPPPPPMEDGKTGYMWVIDGYSYSDAPHWFPAAAWFLMVGTAVAVVVSAILNATGWRLARDAHGRKFALPLALSAFGAAYGLAVAVVGRIWPPTFYSVVLPEPRDPQNPYPASAVIHFDLEPNLITFTATGLAVGLLAAALLYVRNYSLTRTN
ncbi:hypothetical protein [Rhodococcus erythropolis]|jgi:hypothetical protein|uniref:hypothetical protein n=1 Tax=Rhodococcus erythropolis TaxID=1833 RepID=UPI000878F9EB|nr:hypothetical protein [Rhodococcus erythropolis]MDJ0011340.1 hypothetical protein [Rhodococcus erythropolis]OFV76201.1 hypothetical protein RERY_32120 [Rhodococcus erythropolis]QSE40195.1 hypothetical protein JXX30_23115 [Rhodococcus erythropolis]